MRGAIEILLVEDNPNDVELALHALRKANLANRVEVARDGAEALEFIFGNKAQAGRQLLHHPRLILLDLRLPKVDGLEVLRRIKEDPQTGQIPVVVLTTSTEDVDLTECYRLGASSYIVKPVDFVQFVEVVRILGLYWVLLNEPPGHLVWAPTA